MAGLRLSGHWKHLHQNPIGTWGWHLCFTIRYIVDLDVVPRGGGRNSFFPAILYKQTSVELTCMDMVRMLLFSQHLYSYGSVSVLPRNTRHLFQWKDFEKSYFLKMLSASRKLVWFSKKKANFGSKLNLYSSFSHSLQNSGLYEVATNLSYL